MQDKKIGEYKVTDQVLGSGAFSTVYSAFSNKNKKLAVKVIPRHNIKENDLIFFQREINLLRKCKNQWIVDFVDIKKSKSNFYIFLQHCDGGSLAQHITRDKRLSQLEALRIFSQIVRGMSCLKGMNIIHRDLKPANIMLKNGNVKIVDFGLARKFYHGELLKTYVGSPLNMAPEVLKGQPYTDKVDIYSAGTILYEMLYGICPFEARNRELLVKEIDKRKFNKTEQEIQVSQNVINMLKWMLQPQPSKRMDLTELLDFVQTFQKQQRDRKLNEYYRISKRSQPYYGVFSSVAAPFIHGCKRASPKQPLNLDLKMCSKLINQIQY